MLKVALTGGIATGKIATCSSGCEIGTSRQSMPTSSCTKRSARARRRHKRHRSSVRQRVLRPDGSVDRTQLGAKVFSRPRCPAPGSRPSSIPACTSDSQSGSMRSIGRSVWRRSRCCTRQAAKRDFDVVVVTVCPPELQLQRLLERDRHVRRGGTPAHRGAMPADEKANRGDFVISTGGTSAETDRQVDGTGHLAGETDSHCEASPLDRAAASRLPVPPASLAGAIRSSTNVFHSWQCGHCQSSSVLR